MTRLLILTAFIAFQAHLVLARSESNGFDTLPMPQRERDFVAILARAQDKLSSARTIESRKNVRLEMQTQEANFAKQSPSARGWVGVVLQAGVNRDGFAWVSVEIWPGVRLSTARSREVDPEAQTLITEGSNLYQIASSLETGQIVKFDADLIGGRLGSDEEMVRNPEVTARFTSFKRTD